MVGAKNEPRPQVVFFRKSFTERFGGDMVARFSEEVTGFLAFFFLLGWRKWNLGLGLGVA